MRKKKQITPTKRLSSETTELCDQLINRVDSNGNEVQNENQIGNNVALIAVVRTLFFFENLVEGFQILKHNATEDGEELRKEGEPLKRIQVSVEVRVHRQVQGEEPVWDSK